MMKLEAEIVELQGVILTLVDVMKTHINEFSAMYELIEHVARS